MIWEPHKDLWPCKRQCGKNNYTLEYSEPKKADCEFGGTDAGGNLQTNGKVYLWQQYRTFTWTEDQCDIPKCNEGVQ